MAIATPARPSAASHRAGDGDYAAGDLIGAKYRLVSLLGEGGMGTVWLARNTTLHADVALKLVRREIAGSDEAAQRLLTEARAAAQLEHPSIVKVHDFGETERGDPFIVMELLKGEALDEMVDRVGPLAPAAAVQILLPVLSALIAVHEKGIVHRDIKPDNIILVADGAGDVVPKLVDFGIARLQYRTVDIDDGTPATSGRRVTQMGRILGSPEFMSPEQARGDQNVDGRSDLWSIIVVLYHTITASLPFVEDDVEKMLLAILAAEPVPLSQHGIDDPALAEIIERGLHKRVDHRWQDALGLGRALAQWLERQEVFEDVSGRPLYKQWGSQRPGPRTSGYPSMSASRSSNPPISSPPSFDGRVSGPSFPPPAAAPAMRRTDPSWLSQESTLNDALAKSTPPPQRRGRLATLAVGGLVVGSIAAAAIVSMSEPPPPAPAPAAPPTVEPPAATTPSQAPAEPATAEPAPAEPATAAPSASATAPPSRPPVAPRRPAALADDPPEQPAPAPKARGDGSMPLPDDADF